METAIQHPQRPLWRGRLAGFAIALGLIIAGIVGLDGPTASTDVTDLVPTTTHGSR